MTNWATLAMRSDKHNRKQSSHYESTASFLQHHPKRKTVDASMTTRAHATQSQSRVTSGFKTLTLAGLAAANQLLELTG